MIRVGREARGEAVLEALRSVFKTSVACGRPQPPGQGWAGGGSYGGEAGRDEAERTPKRCPPKRYLGDGAGVLRAVRGSAGVVGGLCVCVHALPGVGKTYSMATDKGQTEVEGRSAGAILGRQWGRSKPACIRRHVSPRKERGREMLGRWQRRAGGRASNSARRAPAIIERGTRC